MIGRLIGILIEKNPPQLLLDVQGVGYELEASMATHYQLPACGEKLTLHTHLVVREDAQLLYGFITLGERRLFRQLIKINGVGPKLALVILSGINADEFTRCIQESDIKSLTRLPGVGKKTAERLVIELKDKLSLTNHLSGETIAPVQNTSSDAISALIALGYKANQANQMVRMVDCNNKTTEDIIRIALQGGAK